MTGRCRFLTARPNQDGNVITHPTHLLISTQVVYGYGSPFSSTHFGRAAANLMDGVMLRRLHQGLVPPSLRPEDHSPLEGYAKVSPS